MNNESFNKYIEQAIKENWERIALSDFDGVSYHYKDIARKIAKIHLLLESAEIKKGDKIAICGKNSAHWAVAFFAAITYGAVPVPILHEFKADNIHHIVNHSEAKLLFVGDIVWEDLNETLMKNLKGIFLLNDFSLLRSKSEKLTDMRNRLNEYFGKKYPARFTPDAVSYYEDSPEELAVINYTSGSTGFSKGGATVHDVELMRKTVGPDFGVKAAGGIRTKQDMEDMIKAGATRIGTSHGVDLVK